MLFSCLKKSVFGAALGWISLTYCISPNQTQDLSPIFPPTDLPFKVQIELADFSLPNGLQTFARGTYKGKWLLLAGRTNGLHGFSDTPLNFPPREQNRVVYVVDPIKKTVAARELTDPSSGLTIPQIDSLSVTSPQFYQSGKTLYMTGGYGIDQLTGTFSTKDTLTAIDIPGLMHWVTHPYSGETAVEHIRQIADPIFQVTGGYMAQIDNGPTLLVFGQNFQGTYSDSSNGAYTQQVRRFKIIDNGRKLDVVKLSPIPEIPDPNYRRRDLNVLPVIRSKRGKLRQELVALSGVFTVDTGIWTVPVEIKANGKSFMPDPLLPTTFKQGMNNYNSATLGLYSRSTGDMFMVLLGGITFGFFADGTFQTDAEIPFTNEVTTVQLDRHGHYTQYLMDAQYPFIPSLFVNPGNALLFGSTADFITVDGINQYKNGVIKLDSIKHPKVVGYIVGGIHSTVPNTTTIFDSAASPYIFKVTVIPVK